MNFNITPTPRDFNSNNSPFKGTPRLGNKKNKIIFKDGKNDVSWEIIKIDGDKLTLRNGGKTEVFDAGAAGVNITGAKVFSGNNNSSKSKTDADIISEFGTSEQQKDYAGALVDKGKAEASKITAEAKLAANKATLEYQSLERQMERARKRAELPGKIKETAGEWAKAAAVYGHEHDTIMKAARQIEHEAPQFGDAQWVEDNKKSKTHSQILAEAANKVDSETAKYDQKLKDYQAYQKLLEKSQSSDPNERRSAKALLRNQYGVKKDGKFERDEAGKVRYNNTPTEPELTPNVAYDPSRVFEDNKVSGTVGYATGLLKVAPAVLDDTRDFFKPGDVTYFEDKARRKLVQKYADRYKKYQKKHELKEERLERIKSTKIDDATSRFDTAKSALDRHDADYIASTKEAEAQHQSKIDSIKDSYGKRSEKATLKSGIPLPVVSTESPISVLSREAASNKAGNILEARDKKIESQNKAYDAQKKDAETQNKNVRARLNYEVKTAEENKKSTEKLAEEDYNTSKAKAQDKLERKKEKLSQKFDSKVNEARFKDKEIENQMAFDKLKGSVRTTSDVAKAGLALISKKARRKQLEEEGVDAVNARNARIAYALGDRSLQTRLAAGKVSPLNSLLHPVRAYKRHQINSNIRANRDVGFSENPEITEYYSGEGWKERESEAISRLLDIDYSKFEEQDFAELRPSQNYSQSLIGTEKLIDNSSDSPSQTINSVVNSTTIPNHLRETDVSKISEVLEKSYYSPSPAEKFLQEKLSRGFSENEKIDTEYENMLEDIYQRASSSRII